MALRNKMASSSTEQRPGGVCGIEMVHGESAQKSSTVPLSMTVTVKEQVEVFPEPSVARKVLVVVPTGKSDPLGRPAVWVTLILEQLPGCPGAL